ncbi:endonuclease [Chitinophaga caeni]|uniref:Endonuclease n=2 Tax=Chitinophaga caeni TaxID=2029983 RepID=A0A291QV69_9BACT|nr:endonuclease [Chitinophaga caeni]
MESFPAQACFYKIILMILNKRLLAGCFVAAAFFTACKSSQTKQDQSKKNFKVLTYNIHHANPPGEAKDYIDLDTIAGTIKNSGADLVAIQELDSVAGRSGKEFQLKVLAGKLGMHYYFGKAIDYDGGGYGIGILSKYPILETRTVPLENIAGFSGENRAFIIAKVQLDKQRQIYFGSTHLDVTTAKNRDFQAAQIVKEARTLSLPFIIGGDFNALDTSQTVRTLQSYFSDASQLKAPTIPTHKPRRRIDYLWYAPAGSFKVISEKVLTGEQYGSDHLPFLASFELKTER